MKARLALKRLRKDQREAIAEAVEARVPRQPFLPQSGYRGRPAQVCQGSLERGSTPFPVSGAAPDGAEHGTNVSFAGIRDLG